MVRLTQDHRTVAWDEGDPPSEGGFYLTARLELCGLVEHSGLGGCPELRTWNGFVIPWATREEVERYRVWADDANARYQGVYDVVSWDGDVAVVTSVYDRDLDPVRIEPVDGLYRLGEGWTWSEVTPMTR